MFSPVILLFNQSQQHPPTLMSCSKNYLIDRFSQNPNFFHLILLLLQIQSIHESNCLRSVATVDSVPRGIAGEIATASPWFSNHTKNADCSAPARRCWFSQL